MEELNERLNVSVYPGTLIRKFVIESIDLKKGEIKGWYDFQDLIEQGGKIWDNPKDSWIMKRIEKNKKPMWIIERADESSYLGTSLFPFNSVTNEKVGDFIRKKVSAHLEKKNLESFAEEVKYIEPKDTSNDYIKGKKVLLMFADNTNDYEHKKDAYANLMKQKGLDLEAALITHLTGETVAKSLKLGGSVGLLVGELCEGGWKTPFESMAPKYIKEIPKDKKGIIIAHPYNKEHVLSVLNKLEVNIDNYEPQN
jgi:hypothetical protein